MQLFSVLSYLYPEIIWGPQSTDCLIMDGNITVWDTAKLGPRPTLAQLEAAWPAAQLAEAQAIAQRAEQETAWELHPKAKKWLLRLHIIRKRT